ncbi:MAG: Na+/H+ antiporter subunit E [Anaerolineales bacterium]|nr:Na+/H+ antiporter subunit E [Anaerolineales bacterium]
MFVLNVLLALAWMALTGQFTPINLVAGFGLGYLLLWLARPTSETATYFHKVVQIISFFFFFLGEVIIANLRVAYEVISPPLTMRPGVVAIPLDLQSDAEITLLANLITLTPGSLSLDVSADRRVLYVHSMYVDDVEAFRREIKEGFERRVREVFS